MGHFRPMETHKPLDLTDQQEQFCVAYVTNGGNARNAARTAGYAQPDTQGWRLLTRPRIAARVAKLVSLDITSQLGQPVAMEMDIARNVSTPPRDRLSAIFDLLDRGGLAPPKSPTVAVQVNVDGHAADGQAAIAELVRVRQARLDTDGHVTA